MIAQEKSGFIYADGSKIDANYKWLQELLS